MSSFIAGSPFIGPHRRFFILSFMSGSLHVSSSSSFPSLARTIVRTLVCTHTHTHAYFTCNEVSGRPSLYNEVGFIGCSCALGSFLISTTRTFVPSRPPVVSSFFCLARAHVHIGLHLSFTPPLGEACVCNPCSHRASFEV